MIDDHFDWHLAAPHTTLTFDHRYHDRDPAGYDECPVAAVFKKADVAVYQYG